MVLNSYPKCTLSRLRSTQIKNLKPIKNFARLNINITRLELGYYKTLPIFLFPAPLGGGYVYPTQAAYPMGQTYPPAVTTQAYPTPMGPAPPYSPPLDSMSNPTYTTGTAFENKAYTAG